MHRLVIALVSLIGLTGAAFVGGYLLLFGASIDRAATLAPASTVVYVNVYLQPSTGQQMNLSALIGRLPGFADEASLDEKVDQIVQNLLSGTGIDYRAQVKPWLGDQVAIAGWPGADDPAEVEAVVIAEVRDPEAAEAFIVELAEEGGASFTGETYRGVELQVGEEGAYGLVDEMLVIGMSADALRAVVDTSMGDPSLADEEDFRDTMGGVPADHLASVFIDLAGIAASTGVQDELGTFSTASAVLVAERDGLRVSGSAPFDPAEAPLTVDGVVLGTEPSNLVDWMPEDTLAEIVVFGVRQGLENAETAVGATPEGEEIADTLDTFRLLAAFGLGIDLDADVLPLLDREVAVAIGGFEGQLPSGQLLLRPADAAEAAAALGRIEDGLAASGADVSVEDVDGTEVTTMALPEIGDVSYALVDGVVILAFGPDDVMAAVEAHATGTALADDESYQRTFAVAGTRAGTEVYVDIGALTALAGDELQLSPDMHDILSQIGAFALTAPTRDDRVEFHLLLTVDEP
ncbi:MAG TPA: DUF3352 domain-containing protein [Candidatus Binatia bacterium]|nr:DUF3352 domain-containing protein [Candidatus Binatia bacterium]